MTKHQQPTWLSLAQLPLFASLVGNMLQDTEAMNSLSVEAKEQPWVLDDATIERTITLYTERLAVITTLHEKQLRRFKHEKLTLQQQRTIATLTEQTARTKRLVTELLTLAQEIKGNPIDQILNRDEAELALDVLSGKLKLPKE